MSLRIIWLQGVWVVKEMTPWSWLVYVKELTSLHYALDFFACPERKANKSTICLNAGIIQHGVRLVSLGPKCKTTAGHWQPLNRLITTMSSTSTHLLTWINRIHSLNDFCPPLILTRLELWVQSDTQTVVNFIHSQRMWYELLCITQYER